MTRPTDPPARPRRLSRTDVKTSKHQPDEAATVTDGPKVHALDAEADELPFSDLEETDADGDLPDEPTIHRGSNPPRPSSSRRLSPTLMKIFHRRREQIGLSIEQVAKLAGIDEAEYMRFEATNGNHRLLYDHAVVVARVLGIRPGEMPGLRQKESKDELPSRVQDVARVLHAGPRLVFEGTRGERFGGDLDKVATTPAFAITVGDASLGDAFPKGTMLGFVCSSEPQPGDVVLLRHRKSKLLALRRCTPPAYAGIAAWQPSYVVSGSEWITVGLLQVVLPRA